MKIIAIVSLKGGVGKSTVTAQLGLALVRKGLKVGFIDIDVTGSNLYSALGLEHSPKWGLDSKEEKIVVPKVDGYWLLSVASYAGEGSAVMWEASQFDELNKIKDDLAKLTQAIPRLEANAILENIRQVIGRLISAGKWHFVQEILSKDIVTWPPDLDFIIADMPPSSSAEMFSFFETLKEKLFGVIIVSQPAQLSTIGLIRTIDLLKQRQVPILGLVANQDGFRTKDGRIEYQFLSPRTDLRKICNEAGISFLISIPQSADNEVLKSYFDSLADTARYGKPKTLNKAGVKRNIDRFVTRKFLQGLANFLETEE